MPEVIAHGQGLESDFLDELFVSIMDIVPDGKWIEIKKNHEMVIAGIKHLIDEGFYGERITVVFNEHYTHFRKDTEKPFKYNNFDGRHIDPDAWTKYNAIKDGELRERRSVMERERRKQDRLDEKRKHGKRRKARRI